MADRPILDVQFPSSTLCRAHGSTWEVNDANQLVGGGCAAYNARNDETVVSVTCDVGFPGGLTLAPVEVKAPAPKAKSK